MEIRNYFMLIYLNKKWNKKFFDIIRNKVLSIHLKIKKLNKHSTEILKTQLLVISKLLQKLETFSEYSINNF